MTFHPSEGALRADSYGDHMPDDTSEREPLPAILVTEVEKLNAAIAVVISLAPAAEVAMEASERFAGSFDSVECYASYIGQSVWITVRTKSMTPVIALRRWLAAKGYHLDAGGVQNVPDEFRQVFCLGQIILNVRFPGGEGSTCKYVQTGTKTVPTYELRCDDESKS